MSEPINIPFDSVFDPIYEDYSPRPSWGAVDEWIYARSAAYDTAVLIVNDGEDFHLDYEPDSTPEWAP